jgi:hypothetical protein
MYRQYNIPIKPGRITIAEHRLMTSLEVPRVNYKKYAKETLTILSE